MIIISEDVFLSEEPTTSLNANNPVIGYDNIVDTTNIAADIEHPDYPASNLANEMTNQFWRSMDDYNVEQYLTIDVGVGKETDYLAVANHNFASGEIPLTVEGKEDPGDPWSELVGEVQLVDDGPALFRYEPGVYTDLRLKMGAGAEAPFAAVMYAGKLLVLQRRIYVGHTPINYGREANISTGMSEDGNYLGRIVLNSSLGTSFQMSNMTPDWVRTYLDPFLSVARDTPFFWAWRPGAYPREVGYCWLTNNPKPNNQRPNGMMSVSMDMKGIAIAA